MGMQALSFHKMSFQWVQRGVIVLLNVCNLTFKVHRLVVTDDDDKVIGVLSLSDLLQFLVLRPFPSRDEGNHIDFIFHTLTIIVS